MADITLQSLTEAKADGNGAFDVLMKAAKAHLEDQFTKGKITGPEYATVYLGQLQSAMQTALSFITQREQVNLQAQLLEQQVILAKVAVLKADAEVRLMEQQVLNAQQEVLLSKQQIIKIQEEIKLLPKQGELIDAQIVASQQQNLNLAAEALNIPKQGLLIDAQAATQSQQKANLIAEALNIPKQGALIEAQTTIATQQKLNAAEELKQITAQTSLVVSNKAKVDAETLLVPKQGTLLDQQVLKATQEVINSEVEKRVLEGQVCKLKAEFDYTVQNTLKAGSEVNLLAQKTATEKAQTQAIGVDDDSVIGRQKMLYRKQADGFDRDAEQKAAKMLIDSWSARRMTDEGTVADGTNKLDDVTVGAFVTKMKQGIGA